MSLVGLNHGCNYFRWCWCCWALREQKVIRFVLPTVIWLSASTSDLLQNKLYTAFNFTVSYFLWLKVGIGLLVKNQRAIDPGQWTVSREDPTKAQDLAGFSGYLECSTNLVIPPYWRFFLLYICNQGCFLFEQEFVAGLYINWGGT